MEIRTPAVYVLSSKTAPEATESLRTALGMTPVHTVFIHDNQDLDLACEFLSADEVLKTKSEHDSVELAHAIFQETNMPSLVIGTAPRLDAIYPDGEREAVNA